MNVQRPSPVVKDLEIHIEAAFEYFSLKEGGENYQLPVEAVKKWFKEAGISGLTITGEDTGLSDSEVEATFAACSKNEKGIEFDEFMEFISIIGQKQQTECNDLLQKLVGVAPLAVIDSGISYGSDSKLE